MNTFFNLLKNENKNFQSPIYNTSGPKMGHDLGWAGLDQKPKTRTPRLIVSFSGCRLHF